MADKNSDNKFYPFVAFDPLTGTPSQFVAGRFGQIAYRARKILSRRNRSEIIAAADTLSWLLLGDSVREIDLGLLEWHAKELDEKNGDSSDLTLSDAQLLARVVETVSLEDINEAVPNLTLAELYAVLALGLIDEAAEWEQHYMQAGYAEDESIYPMGLSPYAVDAMEAVCMAESLQGDIPRIQAAKIISAQKRKAALKRHANTNNLKRQFIEFFHTETFKSMAEAARRFYDGLEEGKRKLLAPTNATRTLTDALSAHLKQN